MKKQNKFPLGANSQKACILCPWFSGISKNTNILLILAILFSTALIPACSPQLTDDSPSIRPPVDSIGFATTAHQTDRVMKLIMHRQGQLLQKMMTRARISPDDIFKVSICPHDDYAYASYLYPAALKNIKAKTLFLFGVAHKAAKYNIDNKLVFDDYDYWQGPYDTIRVSPLRDRLMEKLPEEQYMVSHELHSVEHSLEALLPFLQNYNTDIEIIPILIPAMPYQRMLEIAELLAGNMAILSMEENMEWGRDFAIIISNDAVHYGCEDWGGKDLAPFGCDTAGFKKAVQHEEEIVKTITGSLKQQGVKAFYEYTVDGQDYKKYKWTWCGRYSVPMGLLTCIELQKAFHNDSLLQGIPISYSTSISNSPLPVEELGMGVTAPANIHHWVGYLAAGYK